MAAPVSLSSPAPILAPSSSPLQVTLGSDGTWNLNIIARLNLNSSVDSLSNSSFIAYLGYRIYSSQEFSAPDFTAVRTKLGKERLNRKCSDIFKQKLNWAHHRHISTKRLV